MTRYLPLKEPDGTWIERVDLYLLARLCYEDNEGHQVVRQLYDAMLRADNRTPALNSFERVIEEQIAKRNLRHRLFAGQVVLEMVRIAASTNELPTPAQAIRLVCFNQGQHDGSRASPASLEREVRKGWTNYRNTAHLQAAFVFQVLHGIEIEASEEGTLALLELAGAFERFIDTNVVSNSLTWDPWRVPLDARDGFLIDVKQLSAEEMLAVGIGGSERE